MTTGFATLVAAIIAAGAAVLSTFLNLFIAARTLKNQSLAQVAATRISWIEKLRETTAELDMQSLYFCSMSAEERAEEEATKTLNRINALNSYLRMMLDRDDAHQVRIIEEARELISAAMINCEDFTDRSLAFEESVHAVIAAEMQNAKAEMLGKTT